MIYKRYRLKMMSTRLQGIRKDLIGNCFIRSVSVLSVTEECADGRQFAFHTLAQV